MVKSSDGKITPPELKNEIQPKIEDQIMFDLFFEMYQPEQNFYMVVDSYCRVWGLNLDGEDISLLNVMWRTAENHRIQVQKEKMEKQKKESKSPKKPSRGRRR